MTIKPYPRFILSISILLLICCGYFTPAYAQQKPAYTLLWEITGKGLSKPSYLFGAINVKDSRAYNFSDSLFIALSNSSAFAVETHPDTTIKSMVNYGYAKPKPLKGTDHSNEPPKTATDPYRLTLPNGYLYGLAKTYRKKLYGLNKSALANKAPETGNIDDTADEENVEEQMEQLEELISVYEKGNLNTIWGEMQQYYEQGYFTDRNAAMTKELIHLMESESVFASVGVALLPGDDGIIALLKKAGYQVRPVGANFSPIAKAYQIDFAKMEWYTFKDESNHYSVQFPSKPYAYQHEDRVKIWGYIDPATSILFRATSLYTGPIGNTTSAQYVDTAISQYATANGFSIAKTSHVNKFGSTVLIAELQKEGSAMRTHAMHVNHTFYTFTVADYTNLNDFSAVDQFFNSIQISTPTAINTNQWIPYKNEVAAFSVKLPVVPEETKKEFPNATIPDSPFQLTFYMATDKINLMNYIVRYSDYPAGMYLMDRKVIFDNLIEEFKQKGEIAGQVRTISKDGYEGRAVDVVVTNTYLELEIYLKGNRIYILLKQNMNAAVKGKKDQFFESFSFLPNLPNNGVPLALANIEVNMPDKPLMIKKSEEELAKAKKGTSFLVSDQSYAAVDKNSGAMYSIEKNTVSPYYKIKNMDTVYSLFAKELTKDKKMLTNQAVYIGKEKGRVFTSYDSLAHTSTKTQIWFQDNSFYMQSLTGTVQQLANEQVNTFFNVKVKDSQPLFDFKQSKAALIAQNLLSKNAETQQLAIGALSFYEFEREELTHIYTALQQKYTDDTSATGTRQTLLALLEDLTDEKTPTFLKKLYQDNQGQDLIQSKILSVLPYADQKSYDWYFKTLSEAPTFKLKNYWPLFAPLSDSLAFAGANLDGMLKLMEISEYRPMVLDVVSSMLNGENRPTYLPLLEQKKEQLGKYALKDLDNDVAKIKAGDYSLTVNDYLIILPKLSSTPLTDRYTQQVMKIDSVQSLHTRAVAARISSRLAIAPEVLAAQLDSLASRYLIMYAFKEIGKLNEVPAKYRKHEEFARLLMHDYLVEDYDFPENINLLSAIKEGELTYYAFEFTYTEDEVQKTYVGVCGPFNSKVEALDFESYYSLSNFDIKTKDWLKTAKALIKEMEQGVD